MRRNVEAPVAIVLTGTRHILKSRCERNVFLLGCRRRCRNLMPASFRAQENLPLPGRTLGPIGPFPRVELQCTLERRWLHYALLSSDGEFGMVANVAALGPMDGKQVTKRNTSILLLHKRNRGWRASQYNAITHLPLWSAFEQPHAHGEERPLVLAATTQQQAIDLSLARTSRPCTSQCAPFARD